MLISYSRTFLEPRLIREGETRLMAEAKLASPFLTPFLFENRGGGAPPDFQVRKWEREGGKGKREKASEQKNVGNADG
jgi:hypothetical protein